jgi:hypothetical protein
MRLLFVIAAVVIVALFTAPRVVGANGEPLAASASARRTSNGSSSRRVHRA